MPLAPVVSREALTDVDFPTHIISMEAQVTTTSRSAFYHLLQLSLWDLAAVARAMVTSKLDNCNLLYAGLPMGLTWGWYKMQQRTC